MDSPLITKPPVPAAMADKLMASVLSCSSKTLIISKTSGTFAAEDVAKVVEAIKLKNTDTDSQLGIRIATITYIDTVHLIPL
jgi:hypothetical protein